jgi:A/G-specific adenine glycosylase
MQTRLLKWFHQNKRDLPWRTNPDWYKTFLSEIILQQTTVAQGLPYYQKFIQQYPDIKSLANADEQSVLHLWAGLGYYSRARNMLKAARIIYSEHGGAFPQDYKAALALPGIGPYSAAAILSISYKLPHAVIDGNVIRVVCRLYAIKEDTRAKNTLNLIKKHANKILDKKAPGDFNEAMMELGATTCSPRQPLCQSCPINKFCIAYKKNLVTKIPYKSKPAKKKELNNLVGVIKNKSQICIMRRPDSGLLAGMWEFPILEITDWDNLDIHYDQFKSRFELTGQPGEISEEMRQIYSHIDLRFKATIFDAVNKTIKKNNYVDVKWVNFSELKNYAIHNAHKKIIAWLADQ